MESTNDLSGADYVYFYPTKAKKYFKHWRGKENLIMVLDSRFRKNIVVCFNVVLPIIKVLYKVNSDENSNMTFIYKEEVHAKEKIQLNFKCVI